jgi:hypothetical protein
MSKINESNSQKQEEGSDEPNGKNVDERYEGLQLAEKILIIQGKFMNIHDHENQTVYLFFPFFLSK